MPGMRSTLTRAPKARPIPAQRALGVDAPARAVGGRRHGARLVEARAAAVAVDAAGAARRRCAARAPRARQRLQQVRGARVGLRPGRGGGARCSTRIGQAGQAAERGRRRRGCRPAARRRRRAARRSAAGSRSARARRQRPRSSRSTRRPTSPQPTISRRRARRKRGGQAAGKGHRGCGHNRGSVYDARRSLTTRPMTFTVTVQPSGRSFTVERDEPILPAAIRQGIGLPYGCRTAPAARASAGCSRAA